jgi:hypothetical protein
MQLRREYETPLTLGDLIDFLDDLGEFQVINLEVQGCFRGYYDELALWPTGGWTMGWALARRLRAEALGQIFTGYKGGEYLMTETTPVWIGQWDTTSGAGRLTGLNILTGEWVHDGGGTTW